MRGTFWSSVLIVLFIFFFKFFIYYFIGIGVLSSAWRGQEEGIVSLGTVVTNVCELPCRC